MMRLHMNSPNVPFAAVLTVRGGETGLGIYAPLVND